MKTQNTLRHRQQGIALVLFAIGLVVIIGIAGMALDLGRVMLDDTRIQNAMDACALSGAKVAMETSGGAQSKIDAANGAAESTFNIFKADPDSRLPKLEWPNIAVTFSDELNGSYGAFADPPRYVRCAVETYSISTTLASVLGITELGLKVSAVAGPLYVDNCNPMPFHVCGDCGEGGCDIEDDCDAGAEECYGFDVYQGDGSDVEEECYIKNCTGNQCAKSGLTGTKCGLQVGDADQSGNTPENEDTGAGNFGYLRVGGDDAPNQGSSFLADVIISGGAALPGGCDAVQPESVLDSMPGGSTKLVKAFNTMFTGPTNQFPDALADTDTAEGFYSDYTGNGRRIMGVVIAEPYVDEDGKQTCDDQGGTHPVTVLTVGCFFATRPAEEKGSESAIWGQFLGDCSGDGSIPETPDAFDFYKIVLYKDYQSPDS
jgi:hypothetical protein